MRKKRARERENAAFDRQKHFWSNKIVTVKAWTIPICLRAGRGLSRDHQRDPTSTLLFFSSSFDLKNLSTRSLAKNAPKKMPNQKVLLVYAPTGRVFDCLRSHWLPNMSHNSQQQLFFPPSSSSFGFFILCLLGGSRRESTGNVLLQTKRKKKKKNNKLRLQSRLLAYRGYIESVYI